MTPSRSARDVASEGPYQVSSRPENEHDALGGEFPRPVFRGERVGLIRQQDHLGRGRPDLPHLDAG